MSEKETGEQKYEQKTFLRRHQDNDKVEAVIDTEASDQPAQAEKKTELGKSKKDKGKSPPPIFIEKSHPDPK